MTTLIRYHYHRPGKGTPVFDQWLVLERNDVSVLLSESYAGADILIGGAVALARGAPSVWFVFPDAWRDVGRFHDAQGNFTGWYTNICTPVKKDGVDWSSTDLVLDLWIPASGEPQWLDEDELLEVTASGVMDHWTHSRVQKERERIRALLAAGAWPPAVCREIDLALIRTTLRKSGDT